MIPLYDYVRVSPIVGVATGPALPTVAFVEGRAIVTVASGSTADFTKHNDYWGLCKANESHVG